MRAILFAMLAVTAAACGVPNTQFHATLDADTTSIDAPKSIDGKNIDAPDALVTTAQMIIATVPNITVDEGTTGSFGITLATAPTSAVTVDVSSSNTVAAPVSPNVLTFDAANFSVPQLATLSPPVDRNNVSETANVTLSAVGVTDVGVGVTVHDLTTLTTYGWDTGFASTSDIDPGTVIGYQIHVTTMANLTSFGTYVPTANASFRMAIYDDSGSTSPNNLIASMPNAVMLADNANVAPIGGTITINPGYYWLIIRVSASTAIGYSTTTTGAQCYANIDINNITSAWPNPFGGSTCGTAPLMNLSLVTDHQ